MMLNKLWNGSIDNIGWAAVVVGASSFISRFLGVFRDHILAGQFGAGDELDIYFAAFRVPDLIFNLLVLGALSAGFIPVFISLLNNPDKPVNNSDAWRFANLVISSLMVILVILSVIGIILAPQLLRLLTPGFSPDKLAATVQLSRLMFLSPLLLGISGVVGGILQSFKNFFVYSLSPIFYNLGIIAGALFLVPRFGLVGLAWGVVIGATLHLLVQLPALWKLGFRCRPILDWHDQALRQIGRIMVPRTMGLAVSQLNLLVMTILASALASGSLAIFNLANNLQSFPIGIFGISFAIAAFPALSEAAFDKKRLIVNFSQTIRQILFFVIPITVLIFALRAQIIRVVLGTGNFDWQDTIMTMDTLGFFALSLFAQATIPLLVRVFYARHNSSTPFYVGMATVVVNIILSLILGPKMGVLGLALAFSIANILNFILLWVALSFSVGNLDLTRIAIAVFKFSVSAVAAGGTAQIMKAVVWPFIDMTKFSGVFIQLIVSSAAGLLVYLGFCYLLRSEELFGLVSSLRKRLPFGKIKIGDQGEARGV